MSKKDQPKDQPDTQALEIRAAELLRAVDVRQLTDDAPDSAESIWKSIVSEGGNLEVEIRKITEENRELEALTERLKTDQIPVIDEEQIRSYILEKKRNLALRWEAFALRYQRREDVLTRLLAFSMTMSSHPNEMAMLVTSVIQGLRKTAMNLAPVVKQLEAKNQAVDEKESALSKREKALEEREKDLDAEREEIRKIKQRLLEGPKVEIKAPAEVEVSV